MRQAIVAGMIGCWAASLFYWVQARRNLSEDAGEEPLVVNLVVWWRNSSPGDYTEKGLRYRNRGLLLMLLLLVLGVVWLIMD